VAQTAVLAVCRTSIDKALEFVTMTVIATEGTRTRRGERSALRGMGEWHMTWLRSKNNRIMKSNHRIFLLAAAVVAALSGILVFALTPPAPAETPAVVPQYDKDGALIRPKDFYTWTFVGSSIGLSYSKESDPYGPGMFHNVYTQPEACREFLKTGKFPEKTIFIIDLHDSKQEVSIAKHGYTEGESMGMDVSVKDHSHFSEGWAYFNFDYENGKFAEKAKAHAKEACFACHAAHAASDNVFTQYYPVLRKP
jgi:Cytochrome P460